MLEKEEIDFAKEKSKSTDLLCSIREMSTLLDIKNYLKAIQIEIINDDEWEDGYNSALDDVETEINRKIKELKDNKTT